MLGERDIEAYARAVPVEERPIPTSRLAGIGSFLGIYGGEHIAATEFVIGALLVTWGVQASELLLGLVVGNLIAAASYALVTAPIAVDTRLTLFAYLRKVTGPWFQRVFNATWGLISIVWAASMMAISATSLREVLKLPIQENWYPTSLACIILTLSLVLVTVFVAAYGFKGVVRFSSLCVPWMVVIFLAGALVCIPILCNQIGCVGVQEAGGLMSILNQQVFTGIIPEGKPHLTWVHVAMFAWMCGYVYHVGLNDMSIFRYAKKQSYGWVGLFGMFLGHFFAWVCAGIMGAAAAACLGTELEKLDSGAVTRVVLGWSGLIAVVVAGWTTATPNIYRATLSFATFLPRWSQRKIAFLVGAVIAVAACFPAVMRIDRVANAAALLVPSVGAICLVEHWIFPKLGLTRYWNLYRGRRINLAALAAWGVASLFALAGVLKDWMHPYFLPLPTFVVAGCAYVIIAWFFGARNPVSPERRAEVDAIERRIAQLGEEEASHDESLQPQHIGVVRILRVVSWMILATMVSLSMMVWKGSLTLDAFKCAALALTLAYFLCASVADILKRI